MDDDDDDWFSSRSVDFAKFETPPPVATAPSSDSDFAASFASSPANTKPKDERADDKSDEFFWGRREEGGEGDTTKKEEQPTEAISADFGDFEIKPKRVLLTRSKGGEDEDFDDGLSVRPLSSLREEQDDDDFGFIVSKPSSSKASSEEASTQATSSSAIDFNAISALLGKEEDDFDDFFYDSGVKNNDPSMKLNTHAEVINTVDNTADELIRNENKEATESSANGETQIVEALQKEDESDFDSFDFEKFQQEETQPREEERKQEQQEYKRKQQEEQEESEREREREREEQEEREREREEESKQKQELSRQQHQSEQPSGSFFGEEEGDEEFAVPIPTSLPSVHQRTEQRINRLTLRDSIDDVMGWDSTVANKPSTPPAPSEEILEIDGGEQGSSIEFDEFKVSSDDRALDEGGEEIVHSDEKEETRTNREEENFVQAFTSGELGGEELKDNDVNEFVEVEPKGEKIEEVTSNEIADDSFKEDDFKTTTAMTNTTNTANDNNDNDGDDDGFGDFKINSNVVDNDRDDDAFGDFKTNDNEDDDEFGDFKVNNDDDDFDDFATFESATPISETATQEQQSSFATTQYADPANAIMSSLLNQSTPETTRDSIKTIFSKLLSISEESVSVDIVNNTNHIVVLLDSQATECKECKAKSVRGHFCLVCGAIANPRPRKQRFESSRFFTALGSALNIPQHAAPPPATAATEPTAILSPQAVPLQPSQILSPSLQDQTTPNSSPKTQSVYPAKPSLDTNFFFTTGENTSGTVASQRPPSRPPSPRPPSPRPQNNDDSIATLAEQLLLPLPDLSFMLSRTLVIPPSFTPC